MDQQCAVREGGGHAKRGQANEGAVATVAVHTCATSLPLNHTHTLLIHFLVRGPLVQAWFVRRIGAFLARRGRRLVAWDELAEGRLPLCEGSVVMSWRGWRGGVGAARAGHEVIMTPTSRCYLDYRQGSGEGEPGATFAPPLPLQQVYGFDPQLPRQVQREQRLKQEEQEPAQQPVQQQAQPPLQQEGMQAQEQCLGQQSVVGSSGRPPEPTHAAERAAAASLEHMERATREAVRQGGSEGPSPCLAGLLSNEQHAGGGGPCSAYAAQGVEAEVADSGAASNAAHPLPQPGLLALTAEEAGRILGGQVSRAAGRGPSWQGSMVRPCRQAVGLGNALLSKRCRCLLP